LAAAALKIKVLLRIPVFFGAKNYGFYHPKKSKEKISKHTSKRTYTDTRSRLYVALTA
jgi:hypothetical protein